MDRETALKIAHDWNNNQEFPLDKIVYCGIEDDSHFVHLDLKHKPRYAGFGVGLRIYPDGSIKVIDDYVSCLNMRLNAKIINNDLSQE